MAKPITFKVTKRGKRWDVDIPPSCSPTGKRKRESYNTKVEAETRRQTLLTQLKTQGARTIKFTDTQAVDASTAIKLLEECKTSLNEQTEVSLQEAARYYSNYLTAKHASKPLNEVWEASLEDRDWYTFSPEHKRDISYLSKKFLTKFGERIILDINTEEIEEFLRKTYKSPTQFNKVHRILHPAFAYALTKGYISKDPFKAIRQRKVTRGSISVLSIDQAKRITELCKDEFNDCLPAFMIMMFAGVRPQEIQRLDWGAIKFDLNEPKIRITKEVAKGSLEKARPRTILIEQVLFEWLKLVPEEKRQGKIIPPNWRRKNMALRKKAGINGFKDILRHSFASYHLALYNDQNRTMAALGHDSNAMLFRHYDAAVERSEAIKYWTLSPSGSDAPMITEVKTELVS